MKLPLTKKNKIFVTTGSSLEFDLLTIELDEINKSNLYEIIIQVGNGKFIPKNCKSFKFEKSLNPFFKWADLVITHTGAGTLFELLEKGKKVISIPNPSSVDNHELPVYLDKNNFIKFISYKDITDLNVILKEIFSNKIKFKTYVPEKQKIGKEIMNYLQI